MSKYLIPVSKLTLISVQFLYLFLILRISNSFLLLKKDKELDIRLDALKIEIEDWKNEISNQYQRS